LTNSIRAFSGDVELAALSRLCYGTPARVAQEDGHHKEVPKIEFGLIMEWWLQGFAEVIAAMGRQGLVHTPGASTENTGCGSRSEKETSMRMSFMRKGAAAVVGALLMLSVGVASAQTQGMERRDERRDDKAGARATKQACKAGDEKTRAECRQVKRTTKQQGRQDGGTANTAPATNPAPPANTAPATNPAQ
jgi:hypothetical protein